MRNTFNRSIRLILIATMLYGFSFSIWSLYFNLYILSLGYSSDVLGFFSAAVPLAALIFGLPLGMLADRVSRRMCMLIGLAIYFIGVFFEIRGMNPVVIFLLGFTQGTGLMLYQVAQPPFVVENSKPENLTSIFSLNFGIMTISAAIGNLAGGQMPALLESWLSIPQGTSASYKWIITAGIVLAASSLIPIFMIKEGKSSPKPVQNKFSIKETASKIFAQPVARRLVLINFLIGFGASILYPYLNVFLTGKFEIGEDVLGLIFAISSTLVFLASLISPWLVKTMRSLIIPIVTTQSISVFFLLLLGFSPFLWLASIGLFLRNMLMQSSFPLLGNFAMLVSPPDDLGSISSMRIIGWQTGQTIGIFISGFIQSRFGFSPIFIATSTIFGIAITLTWSWFRPLEKELTHSTNASQS